jgi:hypothetical protein
MVISRIRNRRLLASGFCSEYVIGTSFWFEHPTKLTLRCDSGSICGAMLTVFVSGDCSERPALDDAGRGADFQVRIPCADVDHPQTARSAADARRLAGRLHDERMPLLVRLQRTQQPKAPSTLWFRLDPWHARHPRQCRRARRRRDRHVEFTKTEAGRDFALGMQALKRLASPTTSVALSPSWHGARWGGTGCPHDADHTRSSSGSRNSASLARRPPIASNTVKGIAVLSKLLAVACRRLRPPTNKGLTDFEVITWKRVCAVEGRPRRDRHETVRR